ncbi:hypothetical protein PFISCL1PPCAC_15007, partial [Pristionchus fissidentatus]
NNLVMTEESLCLGSNCSLEALLHFVELSEASGISVVDGSELIGNLVTEDETFVSRSGLIDSSLLAASGVITSLGSTEVHFGKGIKRALIDSNDHLLKEILVVRLEVAASHASSGKSTSRTARLEVEGGILSLGKRDIVGKFGRSPESESIDLSEVLLDGVVSL